MRGRDDVVCLCLSGGVAGRRQRAGGFGDQRDRLAYATRADEIGELSAERRRVRAQTLVADGVGTQRQLLDDLPAASRVAGRQQRLREVEQDLAAHRVDVLEHVERSAEQVRRRRQILAPERPASRLAQPSPGAAAEVAAVVAERAELEPVAVRALEMKADDLVLTAAAGLERHGKALVEISARLLEQPAVRSVADQRVTEAVYRVLGAPVDGDDQLLAPQRVEMLVDRGAESRTRERGD